MNKNESPSPKLKRLHKLLILGLVVVFVCIVGVNAADKIAVNRDFYRSGNYLVYSESDSKVLGVATDSSQLDISFSNKTNTSSPLVFGGAQYPDVESAQAWNQLADSGVTTMRRDFFLEYSLPATTVGDYLANKNDIANPSKWKTSFIQGTANIFKDAKSHGMRTIGIVSYAPYWLTQNGSQHGVPTNWQVYEDIVKKLYRINRDNLDYVEIWNEPSYRIFLEPEGSGMSREEAYLQIFLHASRAIRAVDNEINDGKRISIGGPVDYKSDSTVMLNKLLQNPEANQNLDFISFHHYGPTPPDWGPWRFLLKNYGKENLPIFLTEWNFNSDVKKKYPEVSADAAISYSGEMLINFIKEGIAGANYYSLFSQDAKLKTPGHGYLAFYKVNNNAVSLLPQANTWQLMSKTLGLGKGSASVVDTTSSNDLPAVGFINQQNQYGFVISNTSSTAKSVTVHLNNLPFKNFASIDSYAATNSNSGKNVVSSTILPVKSGEISYTILAPPESVVGMIVNQSGLTSYQIDNALRWLYQL